MYYLSNPPYLLLIAGLLASLASGAAFEAVLKQSVSQWQKNRTTQSLDAMKGWQLLTPFLGMAGGVCFFLSAGMEVFGIPFKLALGVALPLTIFISWLIWSQLGKILVQLQEGGSQALDLDI